MNTNSITVGEEKIIPTNIIKIPHTLRSKFERNVSKKLLKTIHPNTEIAKEYCFLFVSQLTSTVFETEDNKIWKRLHSIYLQELFNNSGTSYKQVINVLTAEHTKIGSIIEILKNSEGKDSYSQKRHISKQYKLSNEFRNFKTEKYELVTKEAINLNTRKYWTIRSKNETNPIVKSIMKMYSMVTLPTFEEILQRGRELALNGHKTKKGKVLTYLGGNTKSHFSNNITRSYVEDDLENFKYLTENGFILPQISSEDTNGGRIIDSITLMPSWIRDMIKVNGALLSEFDFSCFHPNIAVSLYGELPKAYTHQMIADELNLPLLDVKIEHLSFFNKHPKQMEKSVVYEYYITNEKNMMDKIIKEKYEKGHKETAHRMFKTEVEIMSRAIEILANENIHVLYVYDAVLCHPEHYDRVAEVMYQVSQEKGVYTRKKNNDGSFEPFNYINEVIKEHYKLEDNTPIVAESDEDIEELEILRQNEEDFIRQQEEIMEEEGIDFKIMLNNANKFYKNIDKMSIN